MLRLLALTGVLLTALVGAGSATAADVPSGFDPTGDDIFQELIREDPLLSKVEPLSAEMQATLDRLPDMTPEELAEYQENVKKGHTRAKMRARRLPHLGSFVGSVLLSVGGSVGLDYALRMEIPGQGFIYRMITGESFDDTMGTDYPSPGWNWCTTNVSGADPYRCSIVSGNFNNGDPLPIERWYFRGQNADPPVDGNPQHICTEAGLTGCFNSGSHEGLPALSEMVHAMEVKNYMLNTGTGTICKSGAALGDCAYVWRTDDEMAAALGMRGSDATEYAGATRKHSTTYNAPSIVQNDYDQAWSDDDTTVENDWRKFIYLTVNPDAHLRDEFELPAPEPNETYSAYMTRLAALGHVGTITDTELASENLAYGPNAVVRVITTPVGGTSTVYDPLNWPTTDPTVAFESAITIRYNPGTAAEAPTTPTPTPIAPPVTTVPSAPSVDFSPVTDIDFGCKFPYGFFCYAVDFSEQFDVAADAPVFTFDMEMDVALGSFDLGTYSVDLNVMDAWMALWRDILSVVMVVGAIYLVATRMLGFKAGGDPGAAMDDVL